MRDDSEVLFHLKRDAGPDLFTCLKRIVRQIDNQGYAGNDAVVAARRLLNRIDGQQRPSRKPESRKAR
jgi:hypothetical protein